MAKIKQTIGTGITERTVTRYTGEDMASAFSSFAASWNNALAEGGGHFGAVVLDVEKACRRILKDAGPVEADSVQDYARRIVRLIEETKAHIKAGDADAAARAAVMVDALIEQAHIKGIWETYALRAFGAEESLKEAAKPLNEQRQQRARDMHAEWQRLADDQPHLSARAKAARIAKEVGGNADTIRRKIKQTKK